MSGSPLPEPHPTNARNRLLHLLASPDAAVPEILRLFKYSPLWESALLAAASEARGHPVREPAQALLLLGFLRARHTLTTINGDEDPQFVHKALSE